MLGDREQVSGKIITSMSMAKAFGSIGGIINFQSKALRDRMDMIGPTQVFSGPLPNPTLGAAVASAKIHLSPELATYQAELKALIAHFKAKCCANNINLKTQSATPVQFIEIGRNDQICAVLKHLMGRGVYCSPAAFPSTPRNHGSLRISLTRHLTMADVDYFLDTLAEVLAGEVVMEEIMVVG